MLGNAYCLTSLYVFTHASLGSHVSLREARNGPMARASCYAHATHPCLVIGVATRVVPLTERCKMLTFRVPLGNEMFELRSSENAVFASTR